VRDFAGISIITREPGVLVVHPAVAANSVKELIALAKARPGTLNYVSTGSGSSNHLAGELFKAMAGIDIVHVPYKGTGPAINDLLAGQVQLRFGSTAAVMPHVKTGRLRALAVTSIEPAALFPDLPTIAATLPGYESIGMVGAFVPVNTPAAIIRRLNEETVGVLHQIDIKQKFLNAGAEAVGSSPEDLMNKMKSEIEKMDKLIKDVGIHAG
jgi:tripartite-type tricarboxylate transporter receptor subunit TctC